MKDSIRGSMLPETLDEYLSLANAGKANFCSCRICSRPFSTINTVTAAGWRETQISGTCECCFDRLFTNEGD